VIHVVLSGTTDGSFRSLTRAKTCGKIFVEDISKRLRVGGATAETRECHCLVGVSREAINQACYLKDITDQPSGIKDFQVAAVTLQTYEQSHQRTDTRTVDLPDLGQIDENIARRGLGEFAQFSPEHIVAVTDQDAAPHVEDRNALEFSHGNQKAHVRNPLPAS
jgi:hypothetical protein